LDRKEPTGPNDAEFLMSFVTIRINNGTGMRYSNIISQVKGVSPSEPTDEQPDA
jgi:hypothetical protein